MNAINIRLGAKDAVIRAWWKGISAADIDISKTINYAIEYYATTGSYINIATIKSIPEESSSTLRKCYLYETSKAYQWLKSRMQEGEKMSSCIKRILRNSIQIGEEEQYISIDDLIHSIESISSKNTEVDRPTAGISYIPQKKIEESFDMKLPEKSTQPTKKINLVEEQPPDLFDKMLGSNRLIL